MEMPFVIWYRKKHILSSLLRFGAEGFALHYKNETEKQKMLITRTIHAHFIGMEG